MNLNEKLMEKHVSAYNRKDFEDFIDTYSPNAKMVKIRGNVTKEADFKQISEAVKNLFEKNPNLHCHIEKRIIFGDFVIDHEVVTGVEGLDKPLEAMAIFQISANQISMAWFFIKD